jgi:hypothetical protein
MLGHDQDEDDRDLRGQLGIAAQVVLDAGRLPCLEPILQIDVD